MPQRSPVVICLLIFLLTCAVGVAFLPLPTLPKAANQELKKDPPTPNLPPSELVDPRRFITKMEVDALWKEILAGDLPPAQEDTLIDAVGDLQTKETIFLLHHEATEKFLAKILRTVWQETPARYDPHFFVIRLYDDRFAREREEIGLHQDRFAFSLPGGTIYIGVQLILKSDSEAEIAGVIGHEIGHTVLRHVQQRMLMERNFSRITYYKLKHGESLESLKILGEYYLPFHMVAMEIEADSYSQKTLYGLGYNDGALLDFFTKTFSGPVSFDIMLRSAMLTMQSHNSGAKFRVSTPEELQMVQAELKKYLEQK